MRRTMRADGGPSLVGAIVFAVFVAANVAAGPEALEGSFVQAAAAGRSAVAAVIRGAADLAIRYGAVRADDLPDACQPWATPRRVLVKRRVCEIRIRWDEPGRAPGGRSPS